MKLEGFAFTLSDNSEVYVAPKKGVESCTATHDEFELIIDVSKGSFKATALGGKALGLGIMEFKRAVFEIPDGGFRTDDEPGNVGILWCHASGCCCNCGGGWICG